MTVPQSFLHIYLGNSVRETSDLGPESSRESVGEEVTKVARRFNVEW